MVSREKALEWGAINFSAAVYRTLWDAWSTIPHEITLSRNG